MQARPPSISTNFANRSKPPKSSPTTTDKRYHAILDSLPKAGISPDNLRALIGRFDTLQKRTPPMEPLLQHLSLALNDYPRIELSSLSWKIADSIDAGEKSPPVPLRPWPPAAAPGGSGR
jgi:hypothetical protein